ncbi:MAG: EAL domain-containing protein [Eubacteriaceae bacterium]|jgi:diguanylate cyclase (GGDEF)-like protein|nr:EAL domain-containing protein [Eubacteriaceae bacterium]
MEDKIYRSRHDLLTGLYDPQTFIVKTEELLSRDSAKKYTFIAIDVDKFKTINDMFGTRLGDVVLKRIAGWLRDYCGGSGTCSRIGGDHFVACMPSELVDAAYLAQCSPIDLSEYEVEYTAICHFGLYEIEDNSMAIHTMRDRAESALDAIKGNYLQRTMHYSELREGAALEHQIAGRMEYALEHGEFRLFYQPVFSLSRCAPVSAEVLVRWMNPAMGMLTPNSFIPVFEHNYFITKMDVYVWEQACRKIKEIRERTGRALRLSVNMSSIDLYIQDIAERFIAILDKYDIGPGELNIEITETSYMDFPQRLAMFIGKMKERGVKMLLDDFGSGFSSFGMLRDLDVDIIKIDRGFVKDIGTDSGRPGNIVNSIIHTAKMLGAQVIAEGAETEDQIKFLAETGCDLVQGYYFAKPMPEQDFLEYLEQFETKKFQDVAYEKLGELDIDSLWESGRSTNMIFESVPGGVGLFEREGGHISAIRVNRRYYEITGTDPAMLFNSKYDLCNAIYEEDLEKLLEACDRSEETGEPEVIVCSMKHVRGQVMLVEIRVCFVGRAGDLVIYSFALQEIRDRVIYEPASRAAAGMDAYIRQAKQKLIDKYIEGGIIAVYCEHNAPIYYCEDHLAQVAGFADAEDLVKSTGGELAGWVSTADYRRLSDSADRVFTADSEHSIDAGRCMLFRKDGSCCWVSISGTVAETEDGRRIAVMMCVDKTAEAEAEMEVRRQLERFRLLSESEHSITFDYDPVADINVYEVSFPGEKTRQYRVEEYTEQASVSTHIYPADREPYLDKLKQLELVGGSGTFDFRHDLFGGGYIWSRVYFTAVTDDAGKVVRVVGRIDDIDDEVRARDELMLRAEKDSLSGLLTRRAAFDRIKEIMGSREMRENAVFMIFDLDNFKSVNDTLGHVAGDRVITAVGDALHRAFRRSTDIIGRLGGDEFVVYYIGTVHNNFIGERYSAARENVTKAMTEFAAEGLKVDLSAGVAIVGPEDTFTTLYQRADDALYRAKRNRTHCEIG